MRNRWNLAEADSLDALGQLVYQSRLLGAEPSLVLWGGGNTSMKITETDFRGAEVRVLRVKGSGSDMKTIERRHFPGVRLDDIHLLENRAAMPDEAMVEFLGHALMEPSAPRPSIETLLHGFVPAASVVHTHADAIVALTNNARGAERVRECFGDAVLMVDYVRPGFTLSKQVGDAAKAHKEIDALVLMNHGFITWGDTARRAYDRHIELVTRAEEWLKAAGAGRRAFAATRARALPDDERRRVAAAAAPVLRGALARAAAQGNGARRCVLRFDDGADVLDFAGSERARELAEAGPATPDHLIHTKRVPLLLDVPDPSDADGLCAQLTAAVDRWSGAYIDYVERHRRTGDPLLDPVPRVVLAPGIGMWTVGRDARAAQVSADIYHHTVSVMAMASGDGGYRSISEAEAFDVEYWPMELYKLSLAPPEKDLARRVALVTGAAGGIGRAICMRLASEGAHVVVTDLRQEACEALAVELCEAHGAGRAVGIAMNVADEGSVRGAFAQAALAYGGLDIIVSNAGLAHSARIDELALTDWQRSLDVNATGHFLVGREAVRLLRAQGIGGALVFNVTKNVLAAGAEFGAYSASKAAELQIARVLAIENGACGVRVNAVNPDAIFSAGLWSPEMKARRAAAQGIPVEQVEEFYRNRNLLKVAVRAEDVANAVLWLASDRSSRTTGCIVPVDGGVREAFPR